MGGTIEGRRTREATGVWSVESMLEGLCLLRWGLRQEENECGDAGQHYPDCLADRGEDRPSDDCMFSLRNEHKQNDKACKASMAP